MMDAKPYSTFEWNQLQALTPLKHSPTTHKGNMNNQPPPLHFHVLYAMNQIIKLTYAPNCGHLTKTSSSPRFLGEAYLGADTIDALSVQETNIGEGNPTFLGSMNH